MAGIERRGLQQGGKQPKGVYVAANRGRGAIPRSQNPDVVELSREIAAQICEARPVVTLPPHLFLPWEARPYIAEGKIVVAGSSAAGTAAAFIADAEGIDYSELTANWDAVASISIPSGMIYVLRKWAGECSDPLGMDSGFVSFRLNLNGNAIDFPTRLLAMAGDFDRPFEVAYAIPGGPTAVVEVLARSDDALCPHVAAAYLDGFFVPTNNVNETLAALLGDGCK